jgi:hypothetical protein
MIDAYYGGRSQKEDHNRDGPDIVAEDAEIDAAYCCNKTQPKDSGYDDVDNRIDDSASADNASQQTQQCPAEQLKKDQRRIKHFLHPPWQSDLNEILE